MIIQIDRNMRKMGREEKLVQLRCLDPVNGAGCEYDKLKLVSQDYVDVVKCLFDHMVLSKF